MNNKSGYVYIMMNEYNTTLYVGVTSDLIKRVYEHKNKLIDGFTKRYNLVKLVYFEQSDGIESAIAREKQLKNWKRKWKEDLIIASNPAYKDLYEDIISSSHNCHCRLDPQSQQNKNNCHSEFNSESHNLEMLNQVQQDERGVYANDK